MYYLHCFLVTYICTLVAGVVPQMTTPAALKMISSGKRTPSLYPPVLKVTSNEGYIVESAEMGTTVRVSPSRFSSSLQIVVHDGDLKPGMPPAVYEYILTGVGSSLFAVDQRGYVYLNAPHIDADPPNPTAYQLNVSSFVNLSAHLKCVSDFTIVGPREEDLSGTAFNKRKKKMTRFSANLS
ncbi:unnamed protein product [Gongylonema pulchrum]|uniref:Cadherin domain-containing protein n=1 Tax=Gongylonema pulchrum TaxID=637853 RepID=A0A183EZW7_9BILA|nr:unnamed protein product [Gongylonema pulchrum]